MTTSNQETTKFQQAQYARIKAKFPTQEELIAATYVRTGMLPMSSFEEGKKVSDIEIGYLSFDINMSNSPSDIVCGFQHMEMKELAKFYEPNDKLIKLIDSVKSPVITTKPAQAKSGNGCAYSKSASC